MTHSSASPPGWAEILLRAVGIFNLVTVLIGLISLGSALVLLFNVLTRRPWVCPGSSPYCRLALVAVILLELPFAAALLCTSIRFIQARASAANLYVLTVAALISYVVGVNVLSAHLSEGAKMGVCSAHHALYGSPIDLFLADWFLFLPHALHVPFLYPIASVILVQLIKWLSGRASSNHALQVATATPNYGSLPLSDD